MDRRGSSGAKNQPKSKFVATYETLFKGESPRELLRADFWDEFLLLKINESFLERTIMLTPEDNLLALKNTLQMIFRACVKMLSDDNKFRVMHSLQTMAVFLRNIFRKRWSNFSVEVVSLLAPLDEADAFFRGFLKSLQNILLSDTATNAIKETAVQLLLVLTCGCDNIHHNALLQYFAVGADELSGTLEKVICASPKPSASNTFQNDSVLLLLLLASYLRHEAPNPFRTYLSAQPKTSPLLPVFGLWIRSQLISQHREFGALLAADKASSSLLGSLWGTTPANTEQSNPYTICGLLLWYELTQLTPPYVSLFNEPASKQPDALGATTLSFAMSYLSFLSLHMKDTATAAHVKLTLICLLAVVDSDEGNALLHDVKNATAVKLWTKGRSGLIESSRNSPQVTEPLICVLFDTLIDLCKNNLRKTVQTDLFTTALAVIHAALCYEKKQRVRIQYKWKDLWAALFLLMKHVSSEDIFSKVEAKALSAKIGLIFNFFVTYGDTFLAFPSDYDDLYYELIRCRPTIDSFHTLALHHYPQLSMYLDNLKTIITHFSSKLDHWAASNTEVPLSPQQVVSIIKHNYESLKLQLVDGLDRYDMSLEAPKDDPVFRLVLRNLVCDYRLRYLDKKPLVDDSELMKQQEKK